MNLFARLFGRRKRTTPVQRPPIQPGFLAIESGLEANFFRKDGKSWPGVLWAIRYRDKEERTTLVRTYYSQNQRDPKEREGLRSKAAQFIGEKLRRGDLIADSYDEIEGQEA